MTQEFWSAKYASANTATSSFAAKYMADVPDFDVKMEARNGSYKHGSNTNDRINEKANEKMSR